MKSEYIGSLIFPVIQDSISDDWVSAAQEWQIVSCKEDRSLRSSCLCGHPGIRYLYTIRNRYNGNELHPIGSECIKKFNRDDFKETMNVQEGLFKLYHAVEKGLYVRLDSGYFSRKLIDFLYRNGAFVPNDFNGFDPENDRDFLMKMFNKRDKNKITGPQHRKIKALIVNQIIPYCERALEFKESKTSDL